MKAEERSENQQKASDDSLNLIKGSDQGVCVSVTRHSLRAAD